MRTRAPLLAILALALLSLLAPSAEAVEYDPVASGTTTLTFAPAFARLLASHHVSVQARTGAKRHGRAIAIPASGGEFEPLRGAGTVESEATIVFVAGKHKVPFRDITFKAKTSPFYAKVGGGQLKVAKAGKLSFKREGFGIGFTATGLRLSAKVATRMSKKLRLGKALAAGQQIGTMVSRVTPASVHLLPKNRISLALDAGFVAKLNKLFVSINPIAPAELGAGPTLSFPIEPESALATDGSSGLIKSGGAVELLQLGSAQIFWREIWLEPSLSTLASEVDLEPSPPKAGKQAHGPLLSLAGGQVSAEPVARTISASGETAVLTAATADQLNSSFSDGKTTFAAGETVGTLSYTAQGH
jgi:hypothetical protein